MARDRPSPYAERRRFSPKRPSRYRSAGACPPRSLDCADAGEGQALALRGKETFFAKRPSRYRSAGACPPRVSGRSQHGEGQALALRGRGAVFRSRTVFLIVARGPVPREFPIDRCMARDRPSPYAERRRFSPRDLPVTVARGPVPREFPIDRCMARDRPSPYGEGALFLS